MEALETKLDSLSESIEKLRMTMEEGFRAMGVELSGGRIVDTGGVDRTEWSGLESPGEVRLSADSLRAERESTGELRTGSDDLRGDWIASEEGRTSESSISGERLAMGDLGTANTIEAASGDQSDSSLQEVLGGGERADVLGLEPPAASQTEGVKTSGERTAECGGGEGADVSGLEPPGESRLSTDSLRAELVTTKELRSSGEGNRGDRLAAEMLFGEVSRLELPVFYGVYPDSRLFRAERYSFINRSSDREKFEIPAEAKIYNPVGLFPMMDLTMGVKGRNVVLKLARDRDKFPPNALSVEQSCRWKIISFADLPISADIAVVGGRMRVVLAGGAPLPSDTQRLINICLGAPIGQGCGLTETCVACTFSEFDDTFVSRVGAPLPWAFVKLIDWPEGGYLTKDLPMPRGEMVIGGTNVTLGYFKNEEKTNTENEKGMRRCYTGDIGQFHIDAEDIDKLQDGKYVSLGKVEVALIVSPYVDNIMLHADPFHNYCVALVVASQLAVEGWAAKQGIVYTDFAELCEKEETINEVHASLVKASTNERLDKFEIPAKIKLLSHPWTLESGWVTAALKLKREIISKEFADDLTKLHA